MPNKTVADDLVPEPTHLALNGRGTSSPADPAQDAWDLDALRLSQDFVTELGGKKKLLTVPVRKPTKQEFFRVHPVEGWRFPTALLTVEEERESYLIAPHLREALVQEIHSVVLFTCLSRQGVVFLWPARLPMADRRAAAWHTSAIEAAQLAMRQWIRIAANQSLGAYDVFEATGYLTEPEWPDESFDEVLKLAFKGRYIGAMDHPVLQRLRGEI